MNIIYYIIVACEQAPLNYLLTYKLSQDHLELFFSAVRSRGGHNNNPTALQFKTAYKRLLMRHHIQSTGNCMPLDETRILSVSDDGTSIRGPSEISYIEEAEKYNLIDKDALDGDLDYADIPNITSLSDFKEAAIEYIAGYVVKIARKKIHCVRCLEALIAIDNQNFSWASLLAKKNRGGLLRASDSVIQVCCEAEKCFQQIQKTERFFPRGKPMALIISTAVLQNFLYKNTNNIFSCLDNHMYDTVVEDNHVHKLIKLISQCYCKIRLHHISKSVNEKAVGTKIRKELTRLIIFKNQ